MPIRGIAFYCEFFERKQFERVFSPQNYQKQTSTNTFQDFPKSEQLFGDLWVRSDSPYLLECTSISLHGMQHLDPGITRIMSPYTTSPPFKTPLTKKKLFLLFLQVYKSVLWVKKWLRTSKHSHRVKNLLEKAIPRIGISLRILQFILPRCYADWLLSITSPKNVAEKQYFVHLGT